ncbi:MAG TPA: carboxypeptidase-like regulatory domain-containing protein, partial [Pyrinomonadaceae bacterium]|nr:carboxypeptidase-like regulatory domain-containing protein [Pyrinomonadaceae bacterium]
MRLIKFASMAFGVILLLALTAFGQSTATLQGSVTDPKGSVVPNATVTARNEATSVERTAQTDSDGNFSIASLPAGTYTIEVQAQGFKRDLVQHFAIEVGRTIQRNFQLEVGDVSENITVTADAPVIESATTSVGTVINQRTVQEIPLNGRHFVDLGLLIPGSVTPPQNGFLTAPLRGQGSFGLNTAG